MQILDEGVYHMLKIIFQVKISSESCLESIPEDIYRQACVYTTEEAVASCQVVGYPAMIKASWGGGGKGIRKVCIVLCYSRYLIRDNIFLSFLLFFW